jgi:hypothetical protein
VTTSTAKQTKAPVIEAPLAPRAQAVISAEEWIVQHGFRSRKLDLRHWLPAIGFKHCQGLFACVYASCAEKTDYVEKLHKHVEAQYSQALFEKYPLPDGKILNVSLDIPLCERFGWWSHGR